MNLLNYILSHPGEVLQLTGEHLYLVLVSTIVAAALGVPAGIFLTRRPKWSRWVLGAANVVQTIPSLALFGFLIPLPFFGGIGERTAIVALILYALLPIILNTHTGIVGVDAIGAGGLGTYIFRGVSMVDNQLILAGAIPAAILALLADFLLGLAERALSPKGLRAR